MHFTEWRSSQTILDRDFSLWTVQYLLEKYQCVWKDILRNCDCTSILRFLYWWRTKQDISLFSRWAQLWKCTSLSSPSKNDQCVERCFKQLWLHFNIWFMYWWRIKHDISLFSRWPQLWKNPSLSSPVRPLALQQLLLVKSRLPGQDKFSELHIIALEILQCMWHLWCLFTANWDKCLTTMLSLSSGRFWAVRYSISDFKCCKRT